MITLLPLACVVMTAQDLRLTLQSGQVVDTEVTLSKADLLDRPVFWIQGNPVRLAVSILGPDGVTYSGPTSNPDAPDQKAQVLIYFASRESSNLEETVRAEEMAGDATIVAWKENATPGVYRVAVKATDLPRPVQLTLRRTTAGRMHDEVEAKRKAEEKSILTSMFNLPEERAPLDEQGNASVTFQEAWKDGDIVLISSTSKSPWTATVQMPDGVAVTKETSSQLNCHWDAVDPQDDIYGVFPAGVSRLELMACPGRMQNGPISVHLAAGLQTAPAELIALVFRPSALYDNVVKQMEDAIPDPGKR